MLNVPKQLIAGVPADWIASHPDYKSENWNLLVNIAGPILVPTTSTPQDNGSWLVEVDGADTEDSPGEYYWSARVIEVDGERSRSLGAGNLQITPNLATVDDGYDGRSKARRIHDGILQALEQMAGGKISEYSIEGRSATYRTLEELNKAEEYWRHRVQQEEGRSYKIIRCRFG